MTQTEQLFRKVYIKSEKDLPPDGYYHAQHKKNNLAINSNVLFNAGYREYWLKNIDWYLLPIDPVPPKRLSDDEKQSLIEQHIIINIKNIVYAYKTYCASQGIVHRDSSTDVEKFAEMYYLGNDLKDKRDEK